MCGCQAYQTSLASRPYCRCHAVRSCVCGVCSTQTRENSHVSGRRPWAASAQSKSLVWWRVCGMLANQPFDALNIAVTSIRCASSCNAFPLTACLSARESFSHKMSFPSSCLQVTGHPAPSSHLAVFFTVRSLSLDFLHSQTYFSFTPKCSAALLLLPNSFTF